MIEQLYGNPGLNDYYLKLKQGANSKGLLNDNELLSCKKRAELLYGDVLGVLSIPFN